MTIPVEKPVSGWPGEANPGRSRTVRSAQSGPRNNLAKKVAAHLEKPWRQPIPGHTRAAFEQVERLLASILDRPIVLDSGCGTGSSTRSLAQRHPDCLVIGIDQSSKRLQKGVKAPLPHREDRCLWVRAELSSFWRLAHEAGWPVRKNYLLYPNPWPKAAHLGRRWHGHPVFPCLLRLSAEIELRTNWRVYAEEFALASTYVLGEAQAEERFCAEMPLSPFEEKYRSSGHALYQVLVRSKKAPANRGFQCATEVHSS